MNPMILFIVIVQPMLMKDKIDHLRITLPFTREIVHTD